MRQQRCGHCALTSQRLERVPEPGNRHNEWLEGGQHDANNSLSVPKKESERERSNVAEAPK